MTKSPAGRAAATGGRKRRVDTGQDRWQTWWRSNRHALISLRPGRRPDLPESGSSAFLTGMGRRPADTGPVGPTAAELSELVLPLLLDALGSDDPAVLHETAIALGKVPSGPPPVLVIEALHALLGSSHTEARHAAILALGILGERTAIPLLWDIMNDTTSARRSLGSTGSVPVYERTSAVIAFGMLCEPALAPQLRRFVARHAQSDRRLAEAGVQALGLVRVADSETVLFLNTLLHDSRLHWSLRAQAPVALARFGEVSVPLVPALLQIMENRETAAAVRHSCAIALGRLAAGADAEVLRTCMRLVRNENDGTLRHFVFMALARIGVQDLASSATDHAGADQIAAFLTARLIDPDRATDLPWIALASGTLARDLPDGSPARDEIARNMHDLLKRHRDPAHQGAIATALGLLGATAAGDDLLELFRETNDLALKAHVAIALGLMDFRGARADLLAALCDDRDPQFRIDVATALGLLGAIEASAPLAARLAESRDTTVRASAALALARLGDRAAIDPLSEFLRDARTDFERCYAVTALGVLADRDPLPWYDAISVDANYLLTLPIQVELLAR